MLVVGHLEEDTVRVITALAFVVAMGFSGSAGADAAAGAGTAVAADGYPPISQCYTVMVSPPLDIRPTITVCRP